MRGNRPTIHRAKLSLPFALALTFFFFSTPTHSQSFRSMGFGREDSRTTLVVKSDGSCLLTNETVEPRAMVEMQIKAMDRWQNSTDDSEDETQPVPSPNTPAANSTQKALTDQELTAKIREMHQQREDSPGRSDQKLDIVDVKSNSVRTVSTTSFSSLKDLFSQGFYTWGPQSLMFENARMETDTNAHLRLTFLSGKRGERFGKVSARQWKASKMKFEWKLILPGKILSSGLPQTEGNTTWLRLDSEQPETLEAGLKLVGTNLVITAEPAGLKIAEPLEVNKLMRLAYNRAPAPSDVPVTDAGPGFLAEPVSISISTVYNFPDAQKLKENQFSRFLGGQSPGTVVTAKLFPPKGRSVKSVSDLKVRKATDDKGRDIPLTASEEEEETPEVVSPAFAFESGESSDRANAARIDIHLGLPAPDAKTIEQLEAEAIALTVGDWKEMLVPNVQTSTNKEIDLSEVLPGARLIITKVKVGRPTINVEGRLEGPPKVGQLEVNVKLKSRNSGSSNSSDNRTRTVGDKTIRNVRLQAYEFDPSGGSNPSGPVTLLVRFPQDLKRERVQFKLTALDLL